ncbi:MAG: hypothetical protein KDD42_05590 [Bdellovibrionales bacterium]|nr:hypothetical protein [Bdellovibrionales bacterium]
MDSSRLSLDDNSELDAMNSSGFESSKPTLGANWNWERFLKVLQLIVLTQVVIFPIRVCGDTTESVNELLVVEPFEAAAKKLVLDSVLQNEPLTFGAVAKQQLGDSQQIDFWRGNVPEWGLELLEIRMYFTKDGMSIQDVSTQDSFYVAITFEDQHITVRSSRPRYKSYIGGMRFLVNSQRHWKGLLEGVHGSGIAALIARGGQDNLRGLMICPVGSQGSTSAGQKPLEAAVAAGAYKLVAVDYKVDGYLQGSVQSGFGLGLARAAIQTTKNIAPSNPYFDENYGRDPSVNVDYSASKSVIVDNAAVNGSSIGGVRLQLELQNQAGYLRRSQLDEIVWIYPLTYKREMEVSTKVRTTSVSLDTCYSILKQRQERHYYSKEELIVTEQYLKQRERRERSLDEPENS